MSTYPLVPYRKLLQIINSPLHSVWDVVDTEDQSDGFGKVTFAKEVVSLNKGEVTLGWRVKQSIGSHVCLANKLMDDK